MGWEKLEAYIAQLPGGLSAHPQCETKLASLLVGLDMYPIEDDAGLPAPLQKILRAANDTATWIPTAHFYAILHAQADVYEMDDDGFRQYAYESNRAMSSSALYRTLFSMISSRTVAKLAASTWRFFNRGFSMGYEGHGDDFQLRLSYPPGLLDRSIAAATAGTLEGALQGARIGPTTVELMEFDETHACFAVKAG